MPPHKPAAPPTMPPSDEEPTPQQAARSLQELTTRRHQAARVRSPRWMRWLGGAVLAGEGLAQDLFPPASGVISLGVIAVLLVLALAVRFRPVGAALGYRASVRGRPPTNVSVVTIGGIAAIIAVEFALHQVAQQTHWPWSHTITGVLVGLLLALGLPWAVEQAYRDHEEARRDGD
ncbi:hypothetical protein ACFPIJ_42825 [Dactylosporangium cerinum]|uniref:Integral membrane protein n=1 Tax=Dactylosporangium cerinum TaxID=1434730 RepID=A0ABV9WAU2_9ACTN